MNGTYKVHSRLAVLVDKMSSARALALLLEEFDFAPSSVGATREDPKLADRIRLILLDHDDGELNLEENEGDLELALDHEEWEPTVDEASSSSSGIDPSAETVISSGNTPVNVELMKIPRFEASLRWIQDFEQSNAIVSRRITKFSSRRSLLGEDARRQAGDDFVEETRTIIIDQNLNRNSSSLLIKAV